MEVPPRDILKNCEGQIDELIHVIKPRLLLALGYHAQKRIHMEDKNRTLYRGIPSYGATHPAAIARAKSREDKEVLKDIVKEDLRKAKEALYGSTM